MMIGIGFDSTSGSATLAASDLARACKGNDTVSVVPPPQPLDGQPVARAADMMLWIAVINAAVGLIHLARFIYDVVQQRKIEVSITLEDGKTYKVKTDMSEEQIAKMLAQTK